MAKRRLNRCGSCNHSWDPKGVSRSTHCPNCYSTDTQFVIDRPESEEAAAKKQTEPPAAAPIFGAHDLPGARELQIPSFGAGQSHSISGHSTPRQTPSKASDNKQRASNMLAVLGLFILVLGVLGGLVLLKTDGQLPGFLRTAEPPVAKRAVAAKREKAGCSTIKRRYRYALNMAKKSPKRWKKWVDHWKQKVVEDGCESNARQKVRQIERH